MKLRRQHRVDLPAKIIIQVEKDGDWADLTEGGSPALNLDWLIALPPPLVDGPFILPFQPRSFRDVLLYERHWVQSSRGYVRHFMPQAFYLTEAFEKLTGLTFPAFRPPKLLARQPIYYFGNHLTMVASGTAVQTPSYTRALDYELELGWVLCKPLLNATPEQALDAVGGFVVINDFSARDVQLQALVEINGKRVASLISAGMRFSIGEVLAHLSADEQLYPGELIATGTFPGGSGIETGRLLRSGDELRLVVEDMGEITHRIL